MIDLRYIKKLLEMLDESTVDSIEISSDKGMKIRLSKTSAVRGVAALPAVAPVPAPLALPAAPGVGVAPQPAAAPEAAERRASEPATPRYLEVKSPMVGTFYSSPEPGAKQYVSVGDRIAKGQILCIIEAMKIMNEIESEFDGVVKEVSVDNTQPVEYGQILFLVDPNG